MAVDDVDIPRPQPNMPLYQNKCTWCDKLFFTPNKRSFICGSCCPTDEELREQRASLEPVKETSVMGRPSQAEDARQKDMRRLEEIMKEAHVIEARLDLSEPPLADRLREAALNRLAKKFNLS